MLDILLIFKHDVLMQAVNRFPLAAKLVLLAAFFSLAGGKWGSYIGLPKYNIFLPDFLFLLGCLLAFLKRSSKNDGFMVYTIIGISFFIAQLLRNPQFTLMTKFRDLLPFFYFLFVPLLCRVFSSLNNQKIVNTIRYASLVHLFWVLPVMFNLLHPISSRGIFGFPIFTPRWDLDGMTSIIGLIAWRRHPKFDLKENDFISLVIVFTLIVQYSRATLVAFFFIIIIYYLRHLRNKKDIFFVSSHRFSLIIVISMIFTVTAVPLLQNLLPQNSVLIRIGLISNPINAVVLQQGAGSTANARLKAQSQLYGWVKQRNQLIFGVGPGTEMVLDSGAVQYLSGDAVVRSPHSWIYGLLCRYGYFGSLIWLFLLTYPLIKTKAILSPLGMPMMGVYVILIVSFFGVIIESPFGSMPLALFVALPTLD